MKYKINEAYKKKPNLVKLYYITRGIVNFEKEMKMKMKTSKTKGVLSDRACCDHLADSTPVNCFNGDLK